MSHTRNATSNNYLFWFIQLIYSRDARVTILFVDYMQSRLRDSSYVTLSFIKSHDEHYIIAHTRIRRVNRTLWILSFFCDPSQNIQKFEDKRGAMCYDNHAVRLYISQSATNVIQSSHLKHWARIATTRLTDVDIGKNLSYGVSFLVTMMSFI